MPASQKSDHANMTNPPSQALAASKWNAAIPSCTASQTPSPAAAWPEKTGAIVRAAAKSDPNARNFTDSPLSRRLRTTSKNNSNAMRIDHTRPYRVPIKTPAMTVEFNAASKDNPETAAICSQNANNPDKKTS